MNRFRSLAIFALGLLCSSDLVISGADWPGYGGPNRDGTSPETGLKATWPKSGPPLAWTFEKTGTGYGGPAVVGGVVYILGTEEKTETAFALSSEGKLLWKAPIGPIFDFDSNSWSGGPNSTPAVSDGKVVALGSQGILVCLDAKDGKEIWKIDLPAAMGAEVNPVGGGPDKMGWGYSWSPIIEEGQVIITPGGQGGLVASLELGTGKVKWRSAAVKSAATYSTAAIGTIAGQKQIVALTQEGPVGISFKDGSLLWSYKKEAPYPDVVCPTPIISGDSVYLSIGFGAGAERIAIKANGSAQAAESVWSEKEIANDNGGVVLFGGKVYGFHLKRGWQCQDLETGKKVWESKRGSLGVGSLMIADGKIFAVAEDKGEVGLIQAKADKYTEVSKFKLPKESSLRKQRGKVWTHPVLSDGKLYVRDQDLLFCFTVK